jgi:hypothetical protein
MTHAWRWHCQYDLTLNVRRCPWQSAYPNCIARSLALMPRGLVAPPLSNGATGRLGSADAPTLTEPGEAGSGGAIVSVDSVAVWEDLFPWLAQPAGEPGFAQSRTDQSSRCDLHARRAAEQLGDWATGRLGPA